MVALARREYSNDNIVQIASRLRSDTKLGTLEYFNIVDFIEGPLRAWLRAEGRGELKIELSCDEPDDALPHVELSTLTLHVPPQIWDWARRGEPDARYKLAHEIGHLVLHAYLDFDFSPDEVPAPGLATPTVEREANRFAHDFLVPASIAFCIGNQRDIARRCSVMAEVAVEQLKPVGRISEA